MSDDVVLGSDPNELERIKDRIAGLIGEHFGKGNNAYYLSQLGNNLGDDLKLVERITGKKFAHFIQEQFDYEIGRAGMHQNVLFLKRPGAPDEPPPSAKPRYHSRFWAAFAVPPGEHDRRFISLTTFDFGPDPDAIASAGGEIREIQAKFLNKTGQSSDEEIMGRIDAWLAANGLERTPFVLNRRRPSRFYPCSILDDMLTALSGDQLRRVVLPLDVVKALRDSSRA